MIEMHVVDIGSALVDQVKANALSLRRMLAAARRSLGTYFWGSEKPSAVADNYGLGQAQSFSLPVEVPTSAHG